MRLDAVRVEYLDDPAEVDALDEEVYVGAPDVVAEHQEALLDALGLGQRYYEVPQVGQPVVDLDDDDRGVGGQRPEGLLVQDPLLGVRALDLALDLGDVALGQQLVAPVVAAWRAATLEGRAAVPVAAAADAQAAAVGPAVLQEPA